MVSVMRGCGIGDWTMRKAIAALNMLYKGGSGSGNFGHAGRQGEVGGSSGGSDIESKPSSLSQLQSNM